MLRSQARRSPRRGERFRREQGTHHLATGAVHQLEHQAENALVLLVHGDAEANVELGGAILHLRGGTCGLEVGHLHLLVSSTHLDQPHVHAVLARGVVGVPFAGVDNRHPRLQDGAMCAGCNPANP